MIVVVGGVWFYCFCCRKLVAPPKMWSLTGFVIVFICVHCTLISLFTLLSMSKVTFTRNNYVLDKLLAISFLPFACVNYLHVNNKYINCILSNSKTEIMLTHGDPECVFLNRRLTHLPATFNICVNFTHSTWLCTVQLY